MPSVSRKRIAPSNETPSTLQAGELGLNLYGLSYHFDRRTAYGTAFNELNLGGGLNYHFAKIKRFDLAVETGLYDDSLSNTARYLSLNAKYEIIKDIIKAGFLISAYRSASVSDHWIPAVIPVFTLRYQNVSFNLVYIPEFPDVNAYDSIGFYMTLHLFRF